MSNAINYASPLIGQNDDRPRAFMIPGVFGDEPQLVNFRSRFSELVHFDLLSLPEVGTRGRVLTNMAETGRWLTDEILQRQPTGTVALLGFSFGASLALEIACQLEGAGREISSLEILDGPFLALGFPATGSTLSTLANPRKAVKAVVVEAVKSSSSVRRLMMSVASLKSAAEEPGEPMRRAMLWHLRNKALKQWKPRPCGAPGLHVTTGCYGEENRERWAELCPNLVHVHIPVVHEHLLKGEALKNVAAAVRAEVERFVAGRGRDETR